MTKNDSLLKRLRALGYPLFETEETENANLTLADMVKSRDFRLWEGFPVVLANSAEKGLFNYEKVNWYLKKPFDRHYLASLIAMSFALYKALNLKFSWVEQFYQQLSRDRKKEFKGFLEKLKNNKDLQVGDRAMSSSRLKTVFNNYFSQKQAKLNDLLSVKEELGLEYALSQLFSPKQKELFLKRLKGEKLTKTEREYFSRVVKKKVWALANPELHRLAQKVMR
jgi:hypothetical protein